MSEEKSKKETRTRTWTVVIYPESAPANWRDIIDESHIEWVESPLHEHDIDASGEKKKPHWHVLLMFGGVKAYDQVVEFVKSLNCPIPKRCHNAKALVRYMAHLDNPDKYQYNISDIVSHGGVDVADLLKPSSSEIYTMIREMMAFVRDNEIIEFQDLMDYAADYRPDDWFPCLCDRCTYVLGQYIKSQRHRKRNEISE